MICSEGTFLHQTGGCGYAARVAIEIDQDADQPYVAFRCGGSGWQGQGSIENATEFGYEDWKLGAYEGVKYALDRCARPQLGVVITRITGAMTDTNPILVGLAAVDAVWKALEFNVPQPEAERLLLLGLSSWTSPETSFYRK